MDDDKHINLAFSKKLADARKDWLAACDPSTYLDQNVDEINYTDFVNKELILFSAASNQRAIPSMVIHIHTYIYIYIYIHISIFIPLSIASISSPTPQEFICQVTDLLVLLRFLPFPEYCVSHNIHNHDDP